MSVTSPFYASYRRLCKKIIKEGLAHFIATDAHNMKSRPPEITKALEKVKKWTNSQFYDTASVLFEDELN
jgi:tyrosine-protein phosphatase YwqE